MTSAVSRRSCSPLYSTHSYSTARGAAHGDKAGVAVAFYGNATANPPDALLLVTPSWCPPMPRIHVCRAL